MSRTRRSSLNGKVNIIGKISDWRRSSLRGLGFYAKKKKAEKKALDDFDDIELLEKLVHEKVDFDWDNFERQREQSMFLKQRKFRRNSHRNSIRQSVVSGIGNFQEVDLNQPQEAENLAFDSGAVQRVDDDSDNEPEFDDESVASFLTKTRKIDADLEVVNQISSEGKAKLKFILEFAKIQTDSKVQIPPDMEPIDRLKLRSTLLHSKLSHSKTYKPRKSNISKRFSTLSLGSANSRTSKSAQNERMGRLKRKLVKRGTKDFVISPQKSALQDLFAQYKGYKDNEHMQKQMQRLRGLEELRKETQIDLMAKENGYVPERDDRFKSVLSHLDVTEAAVEEEAAEGSNEAEDAKKPLKNYDSDSDFEDDELIASFMNAESDNLDQLAAMWDKVDGFNDEESESEEEVEEEEKEDRQKMVRKGWAEPLSEKDNEFVHLKLGPYDSLTSRHLKELKLEENLEFGKDEVLGS